MAFTKQQVISQFLRSFPDAEAQSEEYFDRAWRRLLGEARVVRFWTTLNLTAGQAAYALPGEMVEAERVVLADSFSPADGYQGQVLDDLEDWTLEPDGALGWKIRLSQPARQSTSGPFPVLAIYGCFSSPLALSDRIPDTVADPSVLTSRMKEMACEDLDPESALYYRGEADRKTSDLRAWLGERITGQGPVFRPRWTRSLWRTA